MKIKALSKEMFLTPAVFALFVPISLMLFLMWGFTSDDYWRPYGDRGASYEAWEQANRTFKVRATAYYEVGVFMPGAYFAFESSPEGADEWEEFAVFKVDDEDPIPRESVRFVKEDVAYVHMRDAYVVTVDGGRCWTRWEPLIAPPGGQEVHWSIERVNVGPDGKGSASLQRYDERVKERVSLVVRTEDYGLRWGVHQEAKDDAGTRPAAAKAKSR